MHGLALVHPVRKLVLSSPEILLLINFSTSAHEVVHTHVILVQDISTLYYSQIQVHLSINFRIHVILVQPGICTKINKIS